jgi:hypothetical protein
MRSLLKHSDHNTRRRNLDLVDNDYSRRDEASHEMLRSESEYRRIELARSNELESRSLDVTARHDRENVFLEHSAHSRAARTNTVITH